MRKAILIASLVVATTNVAEAGVPFFNNSDSASTASEKQSSGWRMPRLWGKKDTKPDPQFFYQKPTPPPTTTERITSALTDNSAVRAARGWMTTDQAANATAETPDTISLSRPTGDPTPTLLVSIAQVRENQGDIEGARQDYARALAAAPQDVKTLRELGHFEDRQNQLAVAEGYYAQAAKLAPQDSAVLNDLSLCLARQRKLAPATEVLEKAIALAPNKPLYRNNMATILMEVGQQHQAMHHLLAVHPTAVAYYNMGHLLQKGGQEEAAAAHFTEALRLDPAMKPAEQALAKLSPADGANVPQTAMATRTKTEPAFGPEQAWPSEPVATPAASTSQPAASEPSFGPRLLPPVQ